jgi:3-hydroxybutyryl-CoA dehydrogenase
MNMIGIIGAGTMGKSIAVEFARHGFPVVLISYQRHLSQEDLHLEITRLTDKFGFENKQEILNNIKEMNNFNLLSECNLIVEAVSENLVIKRNAILEAKEHIRKDAIITSNTSSLSIEDIFKGIIPLENVLGLHFFNPVQIMKLV